VYATNVPYGSATQVSNNSSCAYLIAHGVPPHGRIEAPAEIKDGVNPGRRWHFWLLICLQILMAVL
jgi:hypothetical protein